MMYFFMFVGSCLGLIIGLLLIPFVEYSVKRIWDAEEKLIQKHEIKQWEKAQKKQIKKIDKNTFTDEMIIKIEEEEE